MSRCNDLSADDTETQQLRTVLTDLRAEVSALRSEVSRLRRLAEMADPVPLRTRLAVLETRSDTAAKEGVKNVGPRLAVLEHRTESLRNDHTTTDRRVWQVAMFLSVLTLLVVIAFQALFLVVLS